MLIASHNVDGSHPTAQHIHMSLPLIPVLPVSPHYPIQ
uniref:Uncharacterized protein n=1 Tax=Anguilla anguilla TaxID=7936 RepID=A0A0E9VC03_ANGAN